MFLFSTIKSAQRKTGQTITFKLFDVYIAFERKEEIFCIFTRGYNLFYLVIDKILGRNN